MNAVLCGDDSTVRMVMDKGRAIYIISCRVQGQHKVYDPTTGVWRTKHPCHSRIAVLEFNLKVFTD